MPEVQPKKQKKIFFSSLHSGVLDNSGGKILVRKVAGQSGYHGSYSNGVWSLSLPRWRESFVVSGTPTPWRNAALQLALGLSDLAGRNVLVSVCRWLWFMACLIS